MDIRCIATIVSAALSLFLLTGCDPATVQKAKKTAADATIAATQKAEEAKEKVEPYVEKGVEKAKEAYAESKKKAGELAEKAKPYVEKAKTATTQAVETARKATTRAAQQVKSATSKAVDGVR